MVRLLSVLLIGFLVSCGGQKQEPVSSPIKVETKTENSIEITPPAEDFPAKIVIEKVPEPSPTEGLSDTSFIDLSLLDSNILLQFHYADTTNFLKTKVYPCATCFLRLEVAQALVKVNQHLRENGLQLVFFDCYRPLDVQKLMWDVEPDARYVANPYKGSSKHNRGGAVDVTLADSKGNLLDMGTGFDHFGEEAHHAYQNLPAEVLQNRITLKEAMALEGFSPIATEWWHYNALNSASYPASNQAWECP